MIREYRSITEVSGLHLTLTRVQDVSCGELGEVVLANGQVIACQVLEADGGQVRVSLFAPPFGISLADSKVRFFGYGLELPLSEDLLGRAFHTLGAPIDGGPAILPEAYANVNGLPVNPLARIESETVLQTGIPAIDDPAPLHLGKKRTLLISPNESAAECAAQIAQGASISGKSGNLTVIIAAMGMPFAERESLIQTLRYDGLTPRTTLFASLPEDLPIVRLTTPCTAMTAAEYFAFEKEHDVLLILADWAANADAFAEAMNSVTAGNWPLPGMGGYPPAHPYADFGALLERIGCRKGPGGSITAITVLTEDREAFDGI